MDWVGFGAGAALAILHWWLFGKFVQGLTDRPAMARVVLISAGRWALTVALGGGLVRLATVSAWGLASGFVVVSLVVRIVLLVRYRVQFT